MSTKVSLYLQRALVLQEHHRVDAALRDGNMAAVWQVGESLLFRQKDNRKETVSRASENEKIEWSRIRALYSMRDWQACYHMCREFLKQMPFATNVNIYQMMSKTLARMHEEKSGIYDWEKIKACTQADENGIDIGDYSDLVEIRPAGELGRGLFTQTKIAKGAIALVEKAFEFARGIDESGLITIRVVNDLSRNAPEIHIGEDLVARTIFKLQNMSAIWRRQFFDLHDNGYGDNLIKACPEVDGQIVLDSFLIHTIVRLNSMSCGPPSQPGRDRGIWITGSRVNHSCAANCDVEFHGDMLLLRPNLDIEAGEQLTLNYVPLQGLDQLQRRRVLKANWDFDCKCSLCI